MKKIAGDYYEQNPLAELVALRRRVAALERALTAGATAERERHNVAMNAPEAQLPAAADFRPLYLVDAETRFIYRLDARRMADGREGLYLVLAGRLRPDADTLPEEGE